MSSIFFTIGFSICWPVCFPPKAYKNSAPFPWFFGTSMCSSLLLFPSIVWYPLSISGSRIPRVFNTKPLSALEYEKRISNRKYDIIFLHSFSHLKYAHKTRHIYVMSYHAVIFLRNQDSRMAVCMPVKLQVLLEIHTLEKKNFSCLQKTEEQFFHLDV